MKGTGKYRYNNAIHVLTQFLQKYNDKYFYLLAMGNHLKSMIFRATCMGSRPRKAGRLQSSE